MGKKHLEEDDDDMEVSVNNDLVMIVGKSSTGKSASFRNMKKPKKSMYLNCESGKRLPFRSSFEEHVITDPYEIYGAFDHAADNPEDYHSIIIDSLTFMMDMFESVHVVDSENTMGAWGDYQQFFKNLMQQYVAKSHCAVFFTAHTRSDLNENTGDMETYVPVKGALKNNGIEAYFSTIVVAKTVSIKELDKYESDLLNITPEERALGFKHVFQTQYTKETIGERIRSPMGMFTAQQTYMDNDVQLLLDHMKAYFA